MEDHQCEQIDAQTLYNNFFSLNENFNFGLLWKDLSASNHPPLYYAILHTIQSLNRSGEAAYNHAYALNLILAALNAILFFLIMRHQKIPQLHSLIGTIWFSVNLSFIQMSLLHKSYELQLVLSQLLVLLITRSDNKSRLSRVDIFSYAFICLLLYLSHYYGYIFVALLGLWVFMINCLNGRYFKIFQYALSSLFAAFMAIIVYPPTLKDAFGDGYSGGITKKIVDLYWLRPEELIDAVELLYRYTLTWPIIMMVVVIVVIGAYHENQFFKKLSVHRDILILALISLLTHLFIVIISPGDKIWYGYLYLPYILLALVILSTLSRTGISKYVLIVGTIVYLVFIIDSALISKSMRLKAFFNESIYPEHIEARDVVFVSRYGEYMRPFIYHNPYDNLYFIYDQYCADVISESKDKVFFINSSGRTHQHSPYRDRIIKELKINGLKKLGKSRQYDIYSISN